MQIYHGNIQEIAVFKDIWEDLNTKHVKSTSKSKAVNFFCKKNLDVWLGAEYACLHICWTFRN